LVFAFEVNKIFGNQNVLVSNWFWQFTDAVIKKGKGKGQDSFLEHLF